MRKNQRPYAFISYSHKDTAKVLPLIEGIKSRGFQVWYDAGIEAGTEWPEYIGTKLFECNCVLAFITQNALDSANCRREIDFAVELDKKLLAIYLEKKEDINLTPGMRMQINNKQAMLMQNCSGPEEFLNNLSMAEILQPCRITEEWAELYPEEEDDVPVPGEGSLPRLKVSQAEQNGETKDQRGSWNEVQVVFRLGQQLEAEGSAWKAFENYLQAAQLGHPEAMYRVAECYRLGNGTDIQEETAYKWYQKAAQKGITMAMLRQAKCYEQQNGTRKGQEKAFLLFSIAAKLNNVEAMYELGQCHLDGLGTEVDKPAGIAWLEKAAEKEYVQAMYKLGMHYRYDEEGQDPDRAYSWLDSAAYWRHPDAMYELGVYFERRDRYEQAQRWYQLAAQKGNLKAIRELINHRHKNKLSDRELFELYQMAADHGDIHSMHMLARCYAEGKGTKQNPEEAAKWYHEAAEANVYEAMYQWAECCEKGIGIPTNGEEAFSWYQKASHWGYAREQLKLADCYLHGIGTPADEKKALECCLRADQNCGYDWKVKLRLSEYFGKGIGTEKDLEKAFEYCKEAARELYESPFEKNGYYESYHAEPVMKLAELYEKGIGTEMDISKAFQLYLIAAEEGHAEGMHKAADRYAAGIGTEQKPVEAFAWYQRAAEYFTEARYKLAMCYMQGFGTRKDEAKAWEVLRMCGPYGDLYLAQHYETTGELKAAAEHYCKAAEKGSVEAYEVITTAFWYRIRYTLNPFWWSRHRDAVDYYTMTSNHFQKVELPWQIEKPQCAAV